MPSPAIELTKDGTIPPERYAVRNHVLGGCAIRLGRFLFRRTEGPRTMCPCGYSLEPADHESRECPLKLGGNYQCKERTAIKPCRIRSPQKRHASRLSWDAE